MPTQMQEIHLMKLGQLSEIFQSRWIVLEIPIMMRRSIKKLVNIRLLPIHVLEVFSLTPDLRSEILQCGEGDVKFAFHKILPATVGSC